MKTREMGGVSPEGKEESNAPFDSSKLEYVWDQDKKRYEKSNREFCEALNKGENFSVVMGPLYEGKIHNASGFGELWYALVVSADGKVMPFPMLEQSSGHSFEPSTTEPGSHITVDEFKDWLTQTYGEQFVDIVIADESDEAGKQDAIQEAMEITGKEK